MKAIIYVWVLYYVVCDMVHGVVRFVDQPIGVAIAEGETFVLSCVIADKGTHNIFWKTMYSSVLLSMDTDIDPYNKLPTGKQGRYSIIGDAGAGEFNLQVVNASREDAGSYSCLFFSNFNHYSRIATVRIMMPPDEGYPKCSVHPHGATVGDTVRLACRSSGGDPPATLAWVSGNEILRMYMPQNPNPINEVSYKLKDEDLNKVFTCAATTPALKEPLSCSVVAYRKKLFVFVQPVVNRVMEGEYANFHCMTHKKSGTIRWVIGSSQVDPSDSRFSITRKGKRLRILQTTRREHNNVLISCQVMDRFGVAGNGSSLLLVNSWESTTAVMTTELATEVQVLALESDIGLVTTSKPVQSTDPVSTNIHTSVLPLVTEESLLVNSEIRNAKKSYSETVTKAPLVGTTRKATTAQPFTRNAKNDFVLIKNVKNELTTVSGETSTRRQTNNEDTSVATKSVLTMTTKQMYAKSESVESTRLMRKSTIALDSSASGNVQTTTFMSSGVSMEITADDTKKNVHGMNDRTDISNDIVTRGTQKNNMVSQNSIDNVISKGDSVTKNITQFNDYMNKISNDISSQQATSNNGDKDNEELNGSPINVIIGSIVGLVIFIIIVIVLSIIYIKRRRETTEIKAV